MTISVSIIEDDQNVVDQLTAIISTSSLCTLHGIAKNGFSAQGLISTDQTDVYLVDLGLPDADGVDIISLINRRCLSANSLVLSTFGDAKHIRKSVAAGAKGYLLKDEISPDIIKKIVSLHNGGSPLSPVVGRVLIDALHGQEPRSKSNHLRAAAIAEFQLSTNEVVTLDHLCSGLPISAIASNMCISTHTVNQHLRHLYKKLDVHSRAMAVAKAQKIGFTHEI